MTDLRGGGSWQGGDGDRLRLSPEVFPGEQSCIDRQVGEGDIFDTALIPKLQGDTAVGTADAAAADSDVAEGGLALRAEFDRGAGGDQRTVVDDDVFTGAVLHCRGVVVGAVAEGTVVVYIVYHGVSCLHDRAKNLVNLTVAYRKSVVKPKYSAACGSVIGRQSTE